MDEYSADNFPSYSCYAYSDDEPKLDSNPQKQIGGSLSNLNNNLASLNISNSFAAPSAYTEDTALANSLEIPDTPPLTSNIHGNVSNMVTKQQPESPIHLPSGYCETPPTSCELPPTLPISNSSIGYSSQTSIISTSYSNDDAYAVDQSASLDGGPKPLPAFNASFKLSGSFSPASYSLSDSPYTNQDSQPYSEQASSPRFFASGYSNETSYSTDANSPAPVSQTNTGYADDPQSSYAYSGDDNPNQSSQASSGSAQTIISPQNSQGFKQTQQQTFQMQDSAKKIESVKLETARNWTQDYYSVQSTISKSGTELDPTEVMDQLTDMASQFTENAVAFGSIIIQEKHLPDHLKTIQPIDVGGIAGGDKYIHQGIFFKFPSDDHNLYGELEKAIKGAGHEMKGLTGLINWELKSIGLHTIKFPLTIILDYYGYRLVATSLLPFSKNSLVIGSNNGGGTILDGTETGKASAKSFSGLLNDWAKFLNLQPHDVYNKTRTRTTKVSICFDLEGHIGTDGNIYVCDFARVFPPVRTDGIHGSFLYRMFRPEFVKKYRTSLSSDSFLGLQVDKALNDTTREATKVLTTDWLIDAVRTLNKTLGTIVPPPNIISLLLHQSGINLRYLRLASAIVYNPQLRATVNAEIIARTLKSVIRKELRELTKFDQPTVYGIILKFFNLVFSNTEESREYWDGPLQLEMYSRFATPTADFLDYADSKLSNSTNSTPTSSPAPSPPVSLVNSTSDAPASPSIRNSRSSAKKSTASKGSKKVTVSDSPSNQTTSPISQRRSTRVRQPNPNAKMPSWLDRYEEGEDPDYDPKQDEDFNSKEDTEEDVESDEDNAYVPSRYQTAYGEDEEAESDLKPAPRLRTSTRTAKTKSASPSTQTRSSRSTTPKAKKSAVVEVSAPSSPSTVIRPIMPSHSAVRTLAILKDSVDLRALFLRLQKLLGFFLTADGALKFEAVCLSMQQDGNAKLSPNPSLGLNFSDVAEYSPRIKQMFLAPFQTGFRFKRQADSTEDFDEREYLLNQAAESYLECLERNPLGDFALHNLARVLQEQVKYFTVSTNEEKCMQYLINRFRFLAVSQTKELATYEADIYKMSDLIEPRTSKVIKKKSEPWCSESVFKRTLLLRTELNEIRADFARVIKEQEAAGQEADFSELLILLRDSYAQLFDELCAGTKSPSVERKVALQVWKIFSEVIEPVELEKLVELSERLKTLPQKKAFLTRDHWNAASILLFGP